MSRAGFHWLMQRVSGVCLVPLTLWFIIAALSAFVQGTPESFRLFLGQHFWLSGLWTLFSLYHGMLGIQVMVDDYIHGKVLNPLLHFLLFWGTWVLGLCTFGALGWAVRGGV